MGALRPDAFMVITRAERKPPSDSAAKQDYFSDLAETKAQSEGTVLFGDMEAPVAAEPMARSTVEQRARFLMLDKRKRTLLFTRRLKADQKTRSHFNAGFSEGILVRVER